jgi:ATP-dependent helicase/nuclease subunit A
METLNASSPSLNATVRASAGTGKTWLLVTRLIRLLLDGVHPDAILAITFTRKAAAEMQVRLAQRLLELAEGDENRQAELLTQCGIDPNSETLRRASHLFEDLLRSPFPIRTTTFHAFCQDILRRFPLEANIPPGFELLEQTAEIRQEAEEALFNEATKAPDNELAQALETLFDACGGLNNSQTALREFSTYRSDWWAFTANQKNPVEYAARTLIEQLGIDPSQDPLDEFFRHCQSQLVEFAGLLAKHGIPSNQKLVATLELGLDPHCPAQTRFEQVKAVFFTGNKIRDRKASKAQAKSMGETGQARFLELHNQLADKIQHAAQILAAKNTFVTSRAWYLAGSRLIDWYQRIKEEQRLLDFTDLEWKTYQLLTDEENAHWVQYKLDQRIDHFLIDEFQDTNPTQWRLLLPLLTELAAGETHRRRSVFLVGDGKQSIYRFRRAEPRLFDAAQQWLHSHLNAKSYPQNKSRRSAAAIMDLINKVFGQGVLHERLDSFEPHFTFKQDLYGRVELLPLVEDTAAEPEPEQTTKLKLRDPLQQARHVAQDTRYVQEGLLIANKIKELMDDGIIIGQGNETRPLRYNDILILIRKRTHVQCIEAALRRIGVPYIGADRGTLLESLEIQDMVALLNTLISPFNDLALGTVLRSPLFACSDADLMLLAAQRAVHTKAGNWMQRLQRVAPHLPQDAPLRRAWNWLQNWQQLADRIPVHDLLDHIYNEGNVIARYEAAFPGHLKTRVRANLTRFIELALELDSGRYPSLTRFLSRLRNAQEQASDAPDEGFVSAKDDQVRILTIHAAKGLEAPVVFLADASASNRTSRAYRALIDWPPQSEHPSHFLLLGKKDRLDPFSRQVLEKHEQAELREDANLLYVALTRAKQYLFISGVYPKKGRDLGWYGLIRDQILPADVDNRETGFVLQSGRLSEFKTSPPVAAATARISPPTALSRPISVTLSDIEISPSRAGQNGPVADLDAEQIDTQDTGHNIGQDFKHLADEDAQRRGLIIHRMLELLTAADRSPEQVLSRVANEFAADQEQTDVQQCWVEAQAVVRNPAFHGLFDPKYYLTAYNEVPIQYRAGGQRIYGIIDRLVVDRDHVLLVDYKTHRGATIDTLHQFARPYYTQIKLYAQGIQKLWPDKTLKPALLFTACNALYELAPEMA